VVVVVLPAVGEELVSFLQAVVEDCSAVLHRPVERYLPCLRLGPVLVVEAEQQPVLVAGVVPRLVVLAVVEQLDVLDVRRGLDLRCSY
jgi:hypothetical protein